MQFQADQLGVPVVRPRVTETTALGAAYAAGLAVGYWSSRAELVRNWGVERRWHPAMAGAERVQALCRVAKSRAPLVRLGRQAAAEPKERTAVQTHFSGELIGTMTLILLGNGVVAGVSLKGSYAENGGWIVITTAWGLAVICAVIVALAVGSNAHLNPAVTIGVSIVSGDWSQAPALHRRAILGRAARRRARLAALSCRTGRRTDNPAGKRACFCTSPAVRHTPSNVARRDHRHVRARVRRRGDLVRQPVAERARAGFRAVLGRVARLGHRLVARRPDGLRDQSGARLGPAYRARAIADRRQGQLGLGLRADPVLGPIIGAVLAGLAVVATGI